MYFADTRMKTKDNSFQGFPGCWNMAVIVIFATTPNHWIILGIVSLLAISMFIPIKFVHPVRTKRWQYFTLPIALAWVGCAAWAAWGNFTAVPAANFGLLATSTYLLFAGVAQQFTEKI